MKAESIAVAGLRGFLDEQTILLSPSLTVFYGRNGFGKSSICEAWSWLHTNDILADLAPAQEVNKGTRHVALGKKPARVAVADSAGTALSREWGGDLVVRPGLKVPPGSPVLLQYQLTKVVHSEKKDRKNLFAALAGLDKEAEAAKALASAAAKVKVTHLPAWTYWHAIQAPAFVAPHPSPKSASDVQSNTAALLQHFAKHFACEPDWAVVQGFVAGGGKADVPGQRLEASRPRTTSEALRRAAEACSRVRHDLEGQRRLVEWRHEGLSFAKDATCPMCQQATMDGVLVAAIGSALSQFIEKHAEHSEAVSLVKPALEALAALSKLDLGTLATEVDRVVAAGIASGLTPESLLPLRDFGSKLRAVGKLPMPDVTDPAQVAASVETGRALVESWDAALLLVKAVQERIVAQQTDAQYREAVGRAALWLKHEAGFNAGVVRLAAAAALAVALEKEVRTATKAAITAVEKDILHWYKVLRPNDPTPLLRIDINIDSAAGNVDIVSDRAGKEAPASSVASQSNANAIGMACHIARALAAGHETIVLDDPFQSLDDDNKRVVVEQLVRQLLDRGVQVVVFTHELSYAKKLVDDYAGQGAMGWQFEPIKPNGPVLTRLYAEMGRDIDNVLTALELQDPKMLRGALTGTRSFIEGRCCEYLRAYGVTNVTPPNLGRYILAFEALPPADRPDAQTRQWLKSVNPKLPAHAEQEQGSIGYGELGGIFADAIGYSRQQGRLLPKAASVQDPEPGVKKRLQLWMQAQGRSL